MSTAVLERKGTGLEFLRALAAGETPAVPIGETLGFRIVAAEHGVVHIVGRANQRSFNLIGTVHGGWTATVLDTAMALAALSGLDAKHDFTTLDIKINYLRPITLDTGEVKAEGRVINAGRRVALCEGTLKDSQGKLLAHGTSTCLVV